MRSARLRRNARGRWPCRGRSGPSSRLEVGEDELGEQVVDAGDRGLGAIEADPNHHGKPRELRGLLLENIVHGTFLGVNGGQYQKAAQGICRDFGKYLAA
jgi:hypothetical protein